MSKDLLTHLKEQDLLGYGSVFPAKIIQDFMGIEVPDIGTKSDFDQASLKELDAVSYVRDHLLNEGKYLGQVKGHYRVLLPSENIGKVMGYINEAKRKNARAQKLLSSTPLKATANTSDTLKARLLMQADDLQKKKDKVRKDKASK